MIELTTELLIYILIFIVVFSFSFFILKRIFDKNIPSAAVVSLSLSLIATWYLSEGQIKLVEQTYGISQMIFLGIIPFLIFSSFIYFFLDISGIARKIMWVAYGLLNIAFFYNSQINSSTKSSIILGYIFLVILMVLFDTSIRNWIITRKNLRK